MTAEYKKDGPESYSAILARAQMNFKGTDIPWEIANRMGAEWERRLPTIEERNSQLLTLDTRRFIEDLEAIQN